MNKRFPPKRLIIIQCLVLLASIFWATVTGAVAIPAAQWGSLLLSLFSASEQVNHYESIVFSIRLPRVLLAVCVGATLAICGAAMQGMFRNPLADPSLIGVTAGASLGASLMIVVVGSATAGFSFAGTSAWIGLPLVSLGAFAGGILAVVLVYRLARSNDGTSVATMLLAGIGITALSGSFTSLLEFYATNDMLRRISLWRMGGLDGVTEQALILALSTAMVLTIYLSRFGHQLNALLLGESEARHLGIPVESLKRQLVIVVAAGVGVSVALTGAIGFIGLVIPHIVRLAIGPDHRYLLPASALAGAVLLVLSDMIARTLLAPTEIPVGIVTALVGVPFFISLLHRRRLYAMETS